MLGEHIEQAYQALALNEPRDDFDCTKFEQSEGGRLKKQVLKQCWFVGAHSDIGGGYEQHDLADLTLTWMAANISASISLNAEYLLSLPQPVAPWGEQKPHNPITGIYMLADKVQRTIPTRTDDVTHETIHPSVRAQKTLSPALAADLQDNPGLVCELLPLEEELKKKWPYDPPKVTKTSTTVRRTTVHLQENGDNVAERSETSTKHVETCSSSAPPNPKPATLAKEDILKRFYEESSMGALVKEIIANE